MLTARPGCCGSLDCSPPFNPAPDSIPPRFWCWPMTMAPNRYAPGMPGACGRRWGWATRNGGCSRGEPSALPGRSSAKPGCAPCSTITAPATSRRRTKSPSCSPSRILSSSVWCSTPVTTLTARANTSAASALAGLERFADRPGTFTARIAARAVARRARAQRWDYFAAVRQGVFCELGQGVVDFPRFWVDSSASGLCRMAARGTGCPARSGHPESERAAQS